MIQEPTFAILTSLATEPRHGYAIISDVATITDGAVRLKAGTLYGALDRLSRDGLVEVAGEEVVNGRLRRTYTITVTGTKLLRAEATRRQAVTDTALSRLNILQGLVVA